MNAELGPVPEHTEWRGHRNFIVPPDVVPVRRVSPLPSRKRTPCRPCVDGEQVCRAGSREWFGEELFADTSRRDIRAACGSSIAGHVTCLVALVGVLAGRPASTTIPQPASEPMRMPVFVAVAGGDGSAGVRAASPPPKGVPERRDVRPAKRRLADAAPVKPLPAPAPEVIASEAPVDVERLPDPPDAAAENAEETSGRETQSTGTAGGADAGGAKIGGEGAGGGSGRDGVGGGGGSGIGMSPGPYRLGQGIEPPRKIKDVAPIYPSGAMNIRAIGTVAIEAIVGVDGKVHEAKIVHSIPSLDQAALDAVRQWEFTPSRLNGVAIPVIVTVLVKFSLY